MLSPVRLSVTRVDQSKTVEVRIMQLSPQSLGGYFFGNVRDKTSNITWRYATPCLPVIDCKMNDLE